MKIRPYTKEDKKQVVKMVSGILERIFNGDPHQFKVLKEFNSQKDYLTFLLAEVNGKIIGTMGLKKIDKETVRLKRMYVQEEYRRKGIAQLLLDELIGLAKSKGYKKMVLSTYPIMNNAMEFYKRNKFIETVGNDPEQMHVAREL